MLHTARRSRLVGLTAALLAGAFSFSVANAPSAKADVIQTFQNEATRECLDAATAWGSTFICDGSAYQQWNVHVWRDGTRELKNPYTDSCLDDSDAYGLRTFTCNASRFQSWYVHRWNDGTIELKNQATGRCLDDSDAYGLRTFTCNASEFQSWY